MAASFFEYINTFITLFSLGFALYLSEKNPSHRYRIWAGFGFLYTFFGTSLLYTAYPLSWMPEGVGQLFGIFCVITFFSLVASLIYTPLAYFWSTSVRSWKTLFFFSASLLLLDVLRSWIFSLLFYGEGGSVGVHFDVTSPGHALSVTPFIEYAYFGGTYVLTFIVGLLVYTTMYYKKIRHAYILPVLLVLGWIYIHYYIPITTPQTPLKIAVISTDFKDEENEEGAIKERRGRFLSLEKITYSFATSSPDIIVYPEDSRFLRYLTEETLQNLRNSFPKTLFIDGDTRPFQRGVANFSLFYETQGTIKEKNDESLSGRAKIFLFPFSEYAPSLFLPLLPLFLNTTQFESYKKNHTYSPAESLGVYTFNGTTIATLICSELFSYSTVRALGKIKPDIVMFQSNLGVFHNRAWFASHMRSFMKISAATLRTPIIQAGNGADTYIVSSYGKILRVLPKTSTSTTVIFKTDGSILTP